jgi:SAM-dependent methyltransferase
MQQQTSVLSHLRQFFRIKTQAIIAQIESVFIPERKTLCKFLKSRGEIPKCTRYLRRHGYRSHRLSCKDWDLANIAKDLTDGNLLDMGSWDSYILENALLKGLHGEKIGIDLQEPTRQIEGVKFIKGNCLSTPFQDNFFQNITCLSVIEHEIDFAQFAREVSRLLTQEGRLYLTFDYWNPKVKPSIRIFDKEWKILDRIDAENLINEFKRVDLYLVDDIDWSLGTPVINDIYHSPDLSISYTFGLFVFQKKNKCN